MWIDSIAKWLLNSAGFERWLIMLIYLYGCFLKCWYPTTMVFPTKNDHFGVFLGYPYFWKHPYINNPFIKAIFLVSWWKTGEVGWTLTICPVVSQLPNTALGSLGSSTATMDCLLAFQKRQGVFCLGKFEAPKNRSSSMAMAKIYKSDGITKYS